MFGKGKCHSHGAGAFGKFGGKGACEAGPLAMLQGLELSDDQVLKIAEIKGGSFFKMAHNKLDIMQVKKQIFKELLNPQIDRAKIKELAKQAAEKKSQCMEDMLENIIACAEILTPEQKKELKLNKIRCMLGLSGHHEEEDGDEE